MTFKDLSPKADVPFNELLKEASVIDKYIDYCVFRNIRLIGSGTFGNTYHAVAEMSDIGVALKSFENIDMITAKEILNIIHENIIKFYGITKKEDKLSDLMVDILDGVREKFIEGTPILYAVLYNDPIKRPNIQEVVLSFEQLKAESIHNENKFIKNNLFSDNNSPNTSYTDSDHLTHNNKSTTWILEELCKNPESKLITTDIFLKIFPNNDNETTFHENIKKTRKENQIEVIKNKSVDTLINLNHEKKMKFDFIFIDGSHESHDVLSDAVLSWNLLKEGGIMILDDYEWDFFEEEYLNPRIAIDSFLRCYQTQIEIIDKYYQVTIRKITKEGTRTVREGKIID
ncbi:17561_t:CDS:2 [Racocetra fulgida]|uniref:17561_t:CDS:1 n=1 Tax=Racocetra fulgida TaxID=60492 RepID=A0A9N9H6F3_9GLOM|nr:17561_t:CDS:2 [Racocetra fulgida]